MSARRSDVAVWAAGATAGVLAERRLIRRRIRADGRAVDGAQSWSLDGTRSSTVTCGDGVQLAVRESGASAERTRLTVVFVHGYTLTAECWAAQVSSLQEDDLRLVLYDQRGHGASGRGPTGSDTIEQLGRDLAAVLEQRVPEGPIVLAGHSMGGMTIMALAEQHPEFFGDRIVATALVGTSSGGLAEVSLGLPAALSSLPARVASLASRAAPFNRRAERLRAADSDLVRWVNAMVALAPGIPPARLEDVLAAMSRMQAPMRIETMAAFLPTFGSHDRATALAPLKLIPTLVIVGEYDVLTPPEHSAAIARELPNAELVVVPGAGHMVMMESPDVVNRRLRELVAAAARPA